MKKIKILYIMPSLRLCNGVASYAMNYFRNIDHSKFQIDFVVGAEEKSCYFDEIEKEEGKIFYIPKITLKNFWSSIKKIREFLKQSEYDIIHCHVLNMGAFYLYFAKKYGVRYRILHSHATKYADKKLNSIRNFFLSKISISCSNIYFACSKLAGDFLFKNKKYYVINNAINTEKFRYNEDIRKKIRTNYGINNELVIGHVGRFVEQKNHDYILNIFKEIKKHRADVKLLLLGEGPLQDKIKKRVETENIDGVTFTNNVTNVNDFFQAMDVFILPSLFEGLPVVGIEAQFSGLPCILSDNVTKEADITENCAFLSINNKDINLWVDEILKMQLETKKRALSREFIDINYEIKYATKKLETIYANISSYKQDKYTVRVLFKKIYYKLIKKIDEKYIAKIRNKHLNNKNFSIISNNCFAGWVYRRYNLSYLTPTVGLFIMPDCYIKLISDLRKYMNAELTFIDPEESKYKDYIKNKDERFGKYPIGKIIDIEIHFLHYKTTEEAKEKWERRKKRINYDNLIFKFNDQNNCTSEHIKKFINNKNKNKLCFVADINKKNVSNNEIIYEKEFKNNGYIIDDTWFCTKHMKLTKYLNNILK